MKYFIFLQLAAFSTPQMLSAQDFSYGPCSFKCEEIPVDEDVLHSAGDATLLELPSKKISILAWNLYKGRKKDFSKNFDLLSKNKDLILLSEVIDDAPVSTSLLKLGGYGWHMAASFEMKNKVATGTAIGSKVKAHDIHFYRTKDVEPFVKSPKATVVARYVIPGRPESLLALSIHGINWSGDDATERQLRMILPELKEHKGPIVFAGDFNFKNPQRLKLAQSILAEAGLERVPWENPKAKKQLDDAFTRGMKVHHARLIDNDGSDHPAIDLELEIQ